MGIHAAAVGVYGEAEDACAEVAMLPQSFLERMLEAPGWEKQMGC